ncbi:putative membrane protein [Kribbella amoyensis]|uniref:Putative membrane protein n=1 Tax=Kribbella amoyensis TaxID=996641 RepID=A0A561BQ19_9ACTN|nr:hypothetical protein [Kribbella amoyensis]TWD80904.1 putative membrane protein [Kribbella amoyensis]
MNSTVTGAVATYLAQVRAELSDLPAGELEDVLEDVAGHLSEVAGEFETEPTVAGLQDRLGTPRQYADQLRTAAGYPPPSQSADRVAGQEAARKALRWGVIAASVGPFFLLIGLFGGSRDGAAFLGLIGLTALIVAGYLGVRALRGNDPRVVLETPRGHQAEGAIRETIDQIPPAVRQELVAIGQPVWWVARGLVGGGAFFALFGAGAVTVVGALAGAAISVWIGRRTQQDRRWLWYVVPLNLVAVLLVPAWLAASFVGASPSLFSFNDYRPSSGYNYTPRGLSYDGDPISNVYPFDEQGRPVQVRLYTQRGEPINLDLQDCATTYRTRPVDQSTQTVTNLFPLAEIQPDENGLSDSESCQDSTKAPFVPPPAPATPTQTNPTPTPSGTPTTTPTDRPSAPPTKPSATPSGTPGMTLTVSPSR